MTSEVPGRLCPDFGAHDAHLWSTASSYWCRGRCCDSHHFEGCCDGGPGCCPACPINPWRDRDGNPTTDYRTAAQR